MILVEREPTLPHHVEAIRAKVLLCLQASHLLFEYATVPELVAYLEKGLDEMVVAGLPRQLSRVVLLFKDPAALRAVETRMHPLGDLVIAKAPECWAVFERQMEDLVRMARTVEPAWIRQVLRDVPKA